MYKYLIVIAVMLVSCIPNDKSPSEKHLLSINDTSMLKPSHVQGLWIEYKHEYEASFVLILNDTVYLLKGAPNKYYFHHDTMMLTATSRNNRKIEKVTPSELIFINSAHDTIRLKKAI
jgi:hypothetical protein